MTTRVTIEETGATGKAILSAVISGKRERFYWNGPGSRVRLFWAQTLLTLRETEGWSAMTLDEAKEQVRATVRSFEADDIQPARVDVALGWYGREAAERCDELLPPAATA